MFLIRYRSFRRMPIVRLYEYLTCMCGACAVESSSGYLTSPLLSKSVFVRWMIRRNEGRAITDYRRQRSNEETGFQPLNNASLETLKTGCRLFWRTTIRVLYQTFTPTSWSGWGGGVTVCARRWISIAEVGKRCCIHGWTANKNLFPETHLFSYTN